MWDPGTFPSGLSTRQTDPPAPHTPASAEPQTELVGTRLPNIWSKRLQIRARGCWGLSSSCLRSLWPGSPREPDCSAVFPRTRGGTPADTRPGAPRGEPPGRLCGHSGRCSPGCQAHRAWRRLTPALSGTERSGCVFPSEAPKCDGKAWALKLGTLHECPGLPHSGRGGGGQGTGAL